MPYYHDNNDIHMDDRSLYLMLLNSIELPSDEAIEASWEKMKLRLEKERHVPKPLPRLCGTSALETLDDSGLIGLYCEAVTYKVTDEFIEFLEDIMLARRPNKKNN